MNSKFQVQVQERDEVTFVKVAGVIDEDNELTALADKLGPGTAIIDLSEIERINSCGVRDWVNWLGKAEGKGAKIVLVQCSPAIVAQINLVNNFTAKGVVKSFYVPYFCPNCDLEKVLLVETRDMYATKPFKAPSCRCDECDGPMDFDDMEESYFAFLANTTKIVTDGRVDVVVNEFTPTDGDRKIRSRASHTNPGAKTPHTPSLPSVPNLQRQTGSLPQVPAPANGLAQGGTPSGVQTSSAVAESLAPRVPGMPTDQAKAGGKSWMVVVALIVVAVALLGFALFGGR